MTKVGLPVDCCVLASTCTYVMLACMAEGSRVECSLLVSLESCTDLCCVYFHWYRGVSVVETEKKKEKKGMHPQIFLCCLHFEFCHCQPLSLYYVWSKLPLFKLKVQVFFVFACTAVDGFSCKTRKKCIFKWYSVLGLYYFITCFWYSDMIVSVAEDLESGMM